MANDYYPEPRGGHSLTAFIMGAALGAVIALLYAPASGAETRSKMKKLSKDAAREARRRFEQGKERFRETVQDNLLGVAGAGYPSPRTLVLKVPFLKYLGPDLGPDPVRTRMAVSCRD